MSNKIVSKEAVVTAKMGRFIQVTCKDLPKEHHNHLVNVLVYPDCLIGDTGRVEYIRSYNSGVLHFTKEI